MSKHSIRKWSFCIALIAAAAFALSFSSCKSHSTEPPTGPDSSKGEYRYVFASENVRQLRDGEYYLLWIKTDTTATDSAWKELAWFGTQGLNGHPNSIFHYFNTYLDLHSIRKVMLSIESDTVAQAPSSPILIGTPKGDTIRIKADLFSDSLIGDFSNTSAIATFATKSADTTRIKHEFYLMDMAGTEPVPSLIDLPPAASGWTYAVWVTDSTFYPPHRFLYGTFTKPSGFDSDSLHDSYPFPGGYEPPQLTPSSSISVTLEPQFGVANLAHRGPSPFTLLRGALPSFITVGAQILLDNTASTSLPAGNLTIEKEF